MVYLFCPSAPLLVLAYYETFLIEAVGQLVVFHVEFFRNLFPPLFYHVALHWFGLNQHLYLNVKHFSGYVLNSSFSEVLSQLFCAQNVFRPCYLMFDLVSIVGKAFLFPFPVMFLYACGEYERLYRRFGYIESQDMFGSGHVVCV